MRGQTITKDRQQESKTEQKENKTEQKEDLLKQQRYIYLDNKNIIKDKLYFESKLKDGIDTIVNYDIDSSLAMIDLKRRNNNVKIVCTSKSHDIIYKSKIEAKRNRVLDIRYINNTKLVPSQVNTETALLNLDGVITRVREDGVIEFWRDVIVSGYQYIGIRNTLIKSSNQERSLEEYVEKIRANEEYKERLREYEERVGSIEEKRNLEDFLLKYNSNNWDKEIQQNYSPMLYDDYISMFTANGYNIRYSKEYTLGAIRNQIKRDFNIEFNEPTHVKIIAKKGR